MYFNLLTNKDFIIIIIIIINIIIIKLLRFYHISTYYHIRGEPFGLGGIQSV